MSDHVLIRPCINAARGEYDRRRSADLLARKRQLRDDELERLARRIDVIDIELAGRAQIRARELAVELGRRGFDISNFKPTPLPTEREREARRHRGQPNLDPLERARKQDAYDRGRLVRTFTTTIRVR